PRAPTPDGASRRFPPRGLRSVDAAAQPLLGLEAPLVLQRSAGLDPVAEIDVVETVMAGVFDGAEHVVRSQGERGAARVIIAVDGRQGLWRLVGDSDAHQLVTVPIGELSRRRVRASGPHR